MRPFRRARFLPKAFETPTLRRSKTHAFLYSADDKFEAWLNWAFVVSSAYWTRAETIRNHIVAEAARPEPARRPGE